MKRTGLWRGLTSLMCFFLAISIMAGNILEANAATIDTYMGTQSERMESDGALYDKFTPSAELLNADGTGNSHALIQKAIDLNRRQAYEGSVLLKNENNVLPLASGANVTLLGIRSHKPVLGSAFGVKVWGPVINLEQALRDTGLTALRRSSVLSLSGGELQRVFLAQVFAQDPDILVLDEPVNHLDLQYQQHIFSLITGWLQGGKRAVISVVHDLGLARRFGTGALLMHRGRCAAQGTMDEVLTPERLRAVYEMDVYGWMQGLLAPWKEE